MKWESGRQGTGYRKLRLGSGKRWDAWILDFPAGCSIPEHVDPIPGKRHWRANLRLLGEDAFRGNAALRLGPLVVFRSDLPHSVARVSRRRIVLSIGLAT